jgi:membrane-associated protease RseP (regulator of RpoE activity)
VNDEIEADDEPRERSWVPIVLFAATIVTTVMAGAWMSEVGEKVNALRGLRPWLDPWLGPWWSWPAIVREALAFAGPLMGILLAHEMGHFVTARRYGVPVSFPYFIPGLPPFGTLGAVIRMPAMPMPARSLMRIAAFGPFAGIIVAVPLLVLGMMWSEVHVMLDYGGSYVKLGGCGLLYLTQWAIHGQMPEGSDVFLHPTAFAAWAGCFVTSLNLLPVGQLDGSHIVYSLFGELQSRIALLVLAGLAVLGVWYPGWLIFGVFVIVLMGVRHPPTLVGEKAQGVDRVIGWLAVVLFVLTFIPLPMSNG